MNPADDEVNGSCRSGLATPGAGRFGSTTSDIEQAIQDGHDTIMAFLEDETTSFLTLD